MRSGPHDAEGGAERWAREGVMGKKGLVRKGFLTLPASRLHSPIPSQVEHIKFAIAEKDHSRAGRVPCQVFPPLARQTKTTNLHNKLFYSR